MTYKKNEISPLSAERLREELKNNNYTQASFALAVDLDPKYIGFMCTGIRAIPQKRAEQFGELLHVRPEYLLGIDDYKTFDLTWLASATGTESKKEAFLRHCLDFWGYKIIGNNSIYQEDEEGNIVTTGIVYKIQRPNGGISEIPGDKFCTLQDEILRSVRRYLVETIDPQF